jgi:hypothetical protein
MRILIRVFVLLLLADLSWAAMGGDSNTSRLNQAVLDPQTWALSPLVDSPSPFSGEGRAEPGERGPSSGFQPPSPEKGEGEPSNLSLLAGAAIFKNQVGIALAMRGPLVKNMEWEVGGVPPFQIAGYPSAQVTSVVPPFTEVDSVRVRSFGETHVVALYPLLKFPPALGRPGITVDAGAGISMAIVDNEIDRQVTGGVNPGSNADRTVNALFSPRLQPGVAAAFSDRLSLRLDAAWVDYANHDSFGIYNPSLGFRGIIITPLLQIRI